MLNRINIKNPMGRSYPFDSDQHMRDFFEARLKSAEALVNALDARMAELERLVEQARESGAEGVCKR